MVYGHHLHMMELKLSRTSGRKLYQLLTTTWKMWVTCHVRPGYLHVEKPLTTTWEIWAVYYLPCWIHHLHSNPKSVLRLRLRATGTCNLIILKVNRNYSTFAIFILSKSVLLNNISGRPGCDNKKKKHICLHHFMLANFCSACWDTHSNRTRVKCECRGCMRRRIDFYL